MSIYQKVNSKILISMNLKVISENFTLKIETSKQKFANNCNIWRNLD